MVTSHTISYVSIRCRISAYDVVRQHTMSYVSIQCRTSAYDIVRQNTMSYVSIRCRTSAYDVVRQHTMLYVSIRCCTSAYDVDPHGNRLFAGHSNGSVTFQLAQIRVGADKVPVSLVIYIDATYIKRGIPILPIYCESYMISYTTSYMF